MSTLDCIEELQRGEIGYEEALRGIYGVARMMADERGISLQGPAYAGDDFDEVIRDYEKRIGGENE
ncbi:hypothetical protein [Psychrobacillus sp. FSL K6-1415]|uniref:hypothetical protein n=1 Tax=Psychrobacillus sp. FSL K6-1415 TaxID=2921544 RepID=UPI0030FB3C99